MQIWLDRRCRVLEVVDLVINVIGDNGGIRVEHDQRVFISALYN